MSYIPLELEFLNFVTQIRAEYDPWLKQTEGQNKLSSVSLQGTLSETLQEVRAFRKFTCVHISTSEIAVIEVQNLKLHVPSRSSGSELPGRTPQSVDRTEIQP